MTFTRDEAMQCAGVRASALEYIEELAEAGHQRAVYLLAEIDSAAEEQEALRWYAVNWETCDGDFEVDPGAVVSKGDDPGAYVQAWVWVDGKYAPDDVRNLGREPEECAA